MKLARDKLLNTLSCRNSICCKTRLFSF